MMRLKRKAASTSTSPYGVTFTGKSLFRASIVLPANVTVGPFDTRVYLFREEKLLSQGFPCASRWSARGWSATCTPSPTACRRSTASPL